MKQMLKRIFCAANAAVFAVVFALACCTGCRCAHAPGGADTLAIPRELDTGAASAAHPDVRLAQMRYECPDTAKVGEALSALEDALAAGADADALLASYANVRAMYANASDMLSLANLLYAFDVTEPYYQEEIELLYAALSELDIRMADASISILESDAGVAALDAWGPEYAELAYLSRALNSPEIQARLVDEQALIFSYDALCNSFVYTEDGRDWNYASLLDAYDAGELDYVEYLRLYDACGMAFNAEAGLIFEDMTALRSEIASLQGYGNFAAYRYDSYARDYTVTDAKALHAAVKQYLVPVYTAAMRKHGPALQSLRDARFSFGDTLAAFHGAAAAFSPTLLEALNFMLRNELCSFSPDAKKIEISFTTCIAGYGAPYLFTQWKGGSADVRTLIHEFGHYANYYLNAEAGWNSGNSLDLAEVDSQGLELLITDFYPALYGKYAVLAETDMLLEAMVAVITGCMEDEFQQLVYESPSMSLSGMNALYLRLAGEYGLQALYGYKGVEWAAVPHTFQSPMYYISYATSMLLALELYTLEQTDADAARSAYLAIINRAPYAAFRTLAQQNGLSDPLSEDTVRAASDTLRKALLGGRL